MIYMIVCFIHVCIFSHFQFSHTYIGGSYMFEIVLSEHKVVTKVSD